MRLNVRQAGAVATIKAYGTKNPANVWDGWMRFYNTADMFPEPPVPAAAQVACLADDFPQANDTMDVRLRRLREKGLYGIATHFTGLRHPEWTHHPAPVDVVGWMPDDLAGQCSLLYRLRDIPYMTRAYAFSIRVADLGERLLIGEQLELIADPVDRMARDAVLWFTGGHDGTEQG